MREYIQMIGKHAYYLTNGLLIEVLIEDIRTAWGRIDAHITPIAGSRATWVSIDSLRLA